MGQIQKAGPTITDPAHDTFWSGYSVSFQVPDGHFKEVTLNPEMEITD